MDSLLVKIFATALTFSQVTVGPETIKTEFDPVQDQHEVVSLLRAGCAHMRKAFDIEDINIDDLIATAMDDPEAVSGGLPQFRGMNLGDLHIAYKQFCKNETVENSPVDIANVIEFYNRAVANLPDHTRLRGMRLPGASVLLDGRGQKFAEVFEQDQRRVWIPLAEIPAACPQTRSWPPRTSASTQHRGIDERALIRAFIGNLTQSGRPQGGSTITQQLVKNLLVGDDLSYERKMREMIVAARVERLLSKDEILELYLNSVFLGRSSWGIELAARGYFGKPAGELTLAEGALLAALTKGPNFFNPDRHPQRVRDRFVYVLQRMREDDMVDAEEAKRLITVGIPTLVACERPRRDFGFHFTDQVQREARTIAGVEGLTAQTYTVRSTIIPQVQRAAESALQEGLARYEASTGRVQTQAAEANLGDAIRRIETQGQANAEKPAWLQALTNARLPLYDVHWPQAVVLEERGGNVRVGLSDGRIVPLTGPRNAHAQPQAVRRRLCPRHRDAGLRRRQGQEHERTRKPAAAAASDGARGTAGAADGAGRRRGAGEPDRPRPRHGRRLLLSAEPAQPGDAVAAPARLGDQADQLSRGAGEGAAAQYAGARRAADAAADRRRQRPHPPRGLLDAEEL